MALEYRIGDTLRLAIREIVSGRDYDKSFNFFRCWFDIGQTRYQIPPDLILQAIAPSRPNSPIDPGRGELVPPYAQSILRFASDVESDPVLAPYNSGFQSRLCALIQEEFYADNLMLASSERSLRASYFYAETHLLAHWANLGYVEEHAIRNHILQSLIFHPTLYDHQACALFILFKIAGATFAAYTDPAVFDQCLELIRGHFNRDSPIGKEVIELWERDWEGLPPPPKFTTVKPKLTLVNEKGPGSTPVTASRGPQGEDMGLQVVPLPPVESATAKNTDTVSGTPVTQSPSISIATLSDFTNIDTPDDEALIDRETTAPHGTFYLEDGNVEVLCGNVLFRVHTSVLSPHSPVFRRLFAQTNLATAESPNGCPRVLFPGTATDLVILLNAVYPPGNPEKNKPPDFAAFSSLLRITAKYEMPTVRARLLDAVRDGYPEGFKEPTPPEPLGESIFNGPTPHPNEVLNLFIQQKLSSALPMAYYMAARRGPDSLMDSQLPQSATLSPDVLRSAIRGLLALREVELIEIHPLIFAKNSPPCCSSICPTNNPTRPSTSEDYRFVFNHIVGPSQQGTKVLQVPELYRKRRSEIPPGLFHFCSNCVERWTRGHADLRKKAWVMLPRAFGLEG